MTDDDDLRARLAQADPARRLEAAGLSTSPAAHEIRERVMQTIENAETEAAPRGARRWRSPAVVLGTAASVVVVAVAAVVAVQSRGADAPRDRAGAGTTLTLTTPPGTSMSSCVQFDVEFLRPMPVAFAGTVVEVASDSVTLDVDRWYKGGTADRVTIANYDPSRVALDGLEFTDGRRYLVTATDGTVNGCGFSGPATPELENAFNEAFPS